ncbi:integral membrane protein [Enterococcus sp. 10A9_DIV0425]|uniref:Integral membrane protein n=1 Tax=Candidatus Enterococcus wittei TaxID=1987383 RepID=A0A242K1A5_9ENTE|nr:TIGR01906 family membrane protein [Enterococcus sp. 10A9_DIV0425]OTP11441.1 integral membrane protein [Enterococcus sp. 10A9_DIV0425]THE09075.1 TIGR01906 family membrane protein [Enterococcus hirae]
MRKKQWQWLEYGGMVSLFLTLISLAIAITINFRLLYVFDIRYLNILNNTTLDQATLLQNYDQLMAYLNNPFQKVLELADFPMSASGLQHFYEVKQLFLLNYAVFLVSLIPSVFFIRNLRKEQRLWRLIRPFQIGMGVPVVIGFFMLIGFDRFFILFHETIFNNDDWIFDPRTDPIINVLPEQFFMHSFVLFFILLEVFFALVIFIGKREFKNQK